MSILEQIIEKAKSLPPEKQQRLLELAEGMEGEHEKPRRSLRDFQGLLKGVDVSPEDLAEARREMWGNFPREFPVIASGKHP